MNAKRCIRCSTGLPSILLVFLTLFVSHVSPANASDRPITLQVGGGMRIFNDQLGLKNNVCAGFRMDFEVTDRFSLALDYVFSSPTRSASNAIAHISALRGLARVNLLGGSTRPYVIAGAGGVLMNFSDALDAGTGTVTAGVGLSRALGAHHVVSVEGTEDVYASRSQRFDALGRPTYQSKQTYQPLGTISANFGFRF